MIGMVLVCIRCIRYLLYIQLARVHAIEMARVQRVLQIMVRFCLPENEGHTYTSKDEYQDFSSLYNIRNSIESNSNVQAIQVASSGQTS